MPVPNNARVEGSGTDEVVERSVMVRVTWPSKAVFVPRIVRNGTGPKKVLTDVLGAMDRTSGAISPPKFEGEKWAQFRG
jgi:hypothetical protein